MAALLGKGYIELAVKYDGALSQVKGDLAQVGEEGKKTGEAITSHIKKALDDSKQSAASLYDDWTKKSENHILLVRQLAAAEEDLNKKRADHFKTHKTSSEQVQSALADIKRLNGEIAGSYYDVEQASKRWASQVKSDARDAKSALGSVKADNAAIAGAMASDISGVLIKPITLGIQGIKWAWKEVWDFALSSAKWAMVGITGAITAGLGAAFYQGIKRLDNLAEVRLKLKYDGLNSQQSEKLITDVRELAKRLAMPFDELLNQSEIFTAAGIKDSSGITRVMEDAANVAAKTGLSINSVSDTMLRFMEGNTQRAQFMLQTWQQGGANILGWLAEDLNTSNDMIVEMLQKGEISWAQIQKAIEDNLSGFAEQSGQTISDQVGRIWEAVKEIGEAALEPFYGGAVNGISSVVDKLETFAGWIRNHQPEIVRMVGEIGQKFFEIGLNVTDFAVKAMDAFGKVVHAAGTFFQGIGNQETADALFKSADAITAAGAALEKTEPLWRRGANAVQGYTENLQGVMSLTQFGAKPELTPDGKGIILTGTDKQLAETRGSLNKAGINYTTGLENILDENGNITGIRVVPDSDQAKRVIDDLRVSMNKEPMYMDVYLQFHPVAGNNKYAPDGTIRVPGEASRVPVKPGDVVPLPGVHENQFELGGKPFELPKPEDNNGWFGKTSGFGIIRSWLDWMRQKINQPHTVVNDDGTITVGMGGGAGLDKILGTDLASLQGKPPTVPVGADPSPAVGTVNSFIEAVAEAPPTPSPVTADTETGENVISEFLKGIASAEPTAAPLTADVDEAEEKYKQFADMVKNNPLSIPMIASMMGGMGGMGLMAGSGTMGRLNDSQGGGVISQPSVQAAAASVLAAFGDQIRGSIGGSRAYNSAPGTHEVGLAMDIPIGPDQKQLGDMIQAYLQSNAAAMNIKYTIWRDKGTYAGNSTPTFTVPGHQDHIDVQFNSGTSPLVGMSPPTPGADVSDSFGGTPVLPGLGRYGGGVGRPGGGMSGGAFSRAPILPGIDDTGDSGDTTAPTTPWTPTSIPGVDPYHTKPSKDSGPGDDPNANYLPDNSGFMSGIDLTGPNISDAEAAKLGNIADKIDNKLTELDIANKSLDDARNAKKPKAATIERAQLRVKKLNDDIANLKAKFEAAKATAEQSDASNDASGFLPGSGYFMDAQDFMTSPGITPEEAQKLSDQNDKVNDLDQRLAAAQSRLTDLQSNPDAKESTLITAQNQVAKLTRDLEQEKRKFLEMQAKVGAPGDQLSKSRKGKGDSWWDQTLGEFVQKMSPDWGNVGGIISGGLKEELLPPGFSDPTQWGLTQAGSGLLGWLGGVMNKSGNPVAGAILGAGGAALGGDGSGMAQSLMGLIPYPFGNMQIGSPGLAPGTIYDPLVADAGGGGGGLPLGAIPMPGTNPAEQFHMPQGATPGQPLSAGPGNVTIDNSIKVQGDSQSAVTQNTIDKTQSMQAPKVRQYSNSLGRPNFYG